MDRRKTLITTNTTEYNSFVLERTVNKRCTLLEFLADHCTLSKVKIKDALNKGCLHVKHKGKKRRRVRKAKHILLPSDFVQFFYSEKILAMTCLSPVLIQDKKAYSVWYKPHGMMTQGNNYGDHCSLKRNVSLRSQQNGKAYIVHRLDQDAAGLVLIAHSKTSAAYFSQLFKTHSIIKKYVAVVENQMGCPGEKKIFSSKIAERNATTESEVIAQSPGYSKLTINLLTGRKHQIRIHLSQSGYPIVGDRLYGGTLKCKTRSSMAPPLQLFAVSLAFICPVSHKNIQIKLPEEFLNKSCIF